MATPTVPRVLAAEAVAAEAMVIEMAGPMKPSRTGVGADAMVCDAGMSGVRATDVTRPARTAAVSHMTDPVIRMAAAEVMRSDSMATGVMHSAYMVSEVATTDVTTPVAPVAAAPVTAAPMAAAACERMSREA